MRFHELSDFGCFLAGQSIEVAEHDHRAIVRLRSLQHRFRLLVLIIQRSMWIDVSIEQSYAGAGVLNRCSHR